MGLLSQVRYRDHMTGRLAEFPRYPLTFGPTPADANVRYAHLGGQPALPAYAGLLRA